MKTQKNGRRSELHSTAREKESWQCTMKNTVRGLASNKLNEAKNDYHVNRLQQRERASKNTWIILAWSCTSHTLVSITIIAFSYATNFQNFLFCLRLSVQQRWNSRSFSVTAVFFQLLPNSIQFFFLSWHKFHRFAHRVNFRIVMFWWLAFFRLRRIENSISLWFCISYFFKHVSDIVVHSMRNKNFGKQMKLIGTTVNVKQCKTMFIRYFPPFQCDRDQKTRQFYEEQTTNWHFHAFLYSTKKRNDQKKRKTSYDSFLLLPITRWQIFLFFVSIGTGDSFSTEKELVKCHEIQIAFITWYFDFRIKKREERMEKLSRDEKKEFKKKNRLWSRRLERNKKKTARRRPHRHPKLVELGTIVIIVHVIFLKRTDVAWQLTKETYKYHYRILTFSS